MAKTVRQGPVAGLDVDGFNELRICRSGPTLFNKNDVYIGGSLRKYGEFSWIEGEFFGQVVRQGQIVVEVGANFGIHTVTLSRLAGPRGAVFAFEPQRIVFQTLCANLALNQCANVYAIQEAVGVQAGRIAVPQLDPAARHNFGALSLSGTTSGHFVPIRPLDEWDLPACHFLKVDVEGMEKDVLAGAQRTIERHRPIMYVENDRADKSRDLIELVFGFKYRAYWHLPPLFNPDNYAGDPENLFPGIVSVNMLCIPVEASVAVENFHQIDSPEETWPSVAGFPRVG